MVQVSNTSLSVTLTSLTKLLINAFLSVNSLSFSSSLRSSTKAFLNKPCEICYKPVGEWDNYNVKLAMQGIGCGHTSCWKSDVGQMIELKNALKK